jgi:hypothetical protein
MFPYKEINGAGHQLPLFAEKPGEHLDMSFAR